MEQDISGVRQKANNDLVVSFRSVRRAIGVLGLFLPFSLVAYGLFSADGILGSMSAYYYSPMREIFVGTLCALAVFLWTYEGYRANPGEMLSDRLLSRIASLGAAGVALMPTASAAVFAEAGAPVTEALPVTCTLTQCIFGEGIISVVHFLAAAVFFIAMAVIALVLFTRGDASDPAKQAANRIYRICGWTILTAVIVIGLLQFTGLRQQLQGIRPVFWLEVVASIAIAVSWMTKGDAMQPLQRMMVPQR
ncbi:hypothetical protein [Paracoccus tegillarcae]|uniref:DUF998 domain-containing protein n=1 Tax=Paracoccus tegillarcae TaxID=1529068 RepID=A0A2K9EGS5_9RHOB|nr:hypothetical protein [Paracoccus tegillarcae]AUH33549.1 hypothetical protein CUV01_09255 [Paracoccus tegillarcae]